MLSPNEALEKTNEEERGGLLMVVEVGTNPSAGL